MNMKEITCTECHNRCQLKVEQIGEEIVVTGNKCPRGLKSGREEFLGERKFVCGTVRSTVEGVQKVAVKTSIAVPKGMVYKVTLALKRISLDHPAATGDIVCQNICNTGADVIVCEEK